MLELISFVVCWQKRTVMMVGGKERRAIAGASLTSLDDTAPCEGVEDEDDSLPPECNGTPPPGRSPVRGW